MAHKYSNFPDAFAEFENRWTSSKGFFDSAETQHNLALMSWLGGDDHAAIGSLLNAVYFTFISLKDLAQLRESAPDQSELMESIYWAAQGGGGGEVTMDAILSAMVTSDFNNLRTFIGLVDAYRVALWNKPFNSEYYAALARGFSI